MYNIYTDMYTIHTSIQWAALQYKTVMELTVGLAWTHGEVEELEQAGYTMQQQRLLTVLPLGDFLLYLTTVRIILQTTSHAKLRLHL